jgi:hypothetical protein
MKGFLRAMVIPLTIVLGFVLGGAGTFFGLLYWDSEIMNDHDGQAGIGFLIVAFWAGLASAVIGGIHAALWFRKKSMTSGF